MYVTEVASQFGSFINYRKVSIFYTDLAAFTTAGAKTLTLSGVGGVTSANALSLVNSGNFIIPQGAMILAARLRVVTPFTGGSLSAVTAAFGKSAATTALLTASDIFGAAADTLYATATYNTVNALSNAAWTVIATLTPTGDTLSAATAGQMDFEILFTDVSTPSV